MGVCLNSAARQNAYLHTNRGVGFWEKKFENFKILYYYAKILSKSYFHFKIRFNISIYFKIRFNHSTIFTHFHFKIRFNHFHFKIRFYIPIYFKIRFNHFHPFQNSLQIIFQSPTTTTPPQVKTYVN